MRAINLHGALWGEDQYQQERVNVGRNYSLVTALTNVEAVDVATGSINSCVRQLTFPDRDPRDCPKGLTDLTHVIGELHDNVWSHGKSTGFSFAQRSAVPHTQKKEHYLEFSENCGELVYPELRLTRMRSHGVFKRDIHLSMLICRMIGHSSFPRTLLGVVCLATGFRSKKKIIIIKGLGCIT